MGLHTYTDICRNVLTIGEAEFLQNYFQTIWENEQDESDDPDNDYLNYSTIKDWRLNGEAVDVGKKKKLMAAELVKNDKILYAINTSEYESVGECWYVVFSDDKTAVEEFLKDFYTEIQTERGAAPEWDVIEIIDSVKQTI